MFNINAANESRNDYDKDTIWFHVAVSGILGAMLANPQKETPIICLQGRGHLAGPLFQIH